MNSRYVKRLAESYVTGNDYYGSAVTLAEFLTDMITSGHVKLIEPKFPFTFAGITADLTENDLATVIAHATNNRKIQAIKIVRDSSGIGLREAKDFVYGIEHILTLSREISDDLYDM